MSPSAGPEEIQLLQKLEEANRSVVVLGNICGRKRKSKVMFDRSIYYLLRVKLLKKSTPLVLHFQSTRSWPEVTSVTQRPIKYVQTFQRLWPLPPRLNKFRYVQPISIKQYQQYAIRRDMWVANQRQETSFTFRTSLSYSQWCQYFVLTDRTRYLSTCRAVC